MGAAQMYVVAVLFVFGAIGQVAELVAHRRCGEPWALDAIVAAMCVASAGLNVRSARKERKLIAQREVALEHLRRSWVARIDDQRRRP